MPNDTSHNKSLFEISDELQQILALLEENGGEITDEIEDRLNINRNELNDKLNSYRFVIAKHESDIEFLKEQSKLLAAKVKAKETVIEQLKYRIKIAVELYGEPTKTGTLAVNTGVFKYSLIKTKPVIVMDPTAEILDPYKEYTVTIKGDRAKVDNLLARITDTIVPAEEIVVSNTIDKKQLKEGLTNVQPILVEKEDGSIEQINPFTDIAYIDEQAGYVRMT